MQRIKFFLPIMLIAGILFSGCTIGNTQFVFGEAVSRELVFDMGSYGDCDKQKALVYLLIAKAEYEEIFGADVWQMQIDGLSMEEFVKNNTLSELLQRESMSALAKNEGIELSKKQLESIADATDELYASVDKAKLSKFEITKQDIEDVFRAYMLSELIYDEIAATVNTEISDSEAKVITVQYIELDVAVELEDMQKEELFSRANVTEVDICRGELAEVLGSEAESMIFALEEGEISDILTVEDKRYIFRSVSAYDADKTEKNKEVMLNQRKQDAFLTKYKEFMDSTEYKTNDKVWDTLIIADFDGISFGGFYDICDKYGI